MCNLVYIFVGNYELYMLVIDIYSLGDWGLFQEGLLKSLFQAFTFFRFYNLVGRDFGWPED